MRDYAPGTSRCAHALAALIFASACGRIADPVPPSLCSAGELPTEAVVTVAWRNSTDAMRIPVRGESKVRAACDFLAGSSQAGIPMGQIRAGPGPGDTAIPFHYVPESVTFVEVAIELCDSALLRTPAQVESYFAGTGSDINGTAPYCPWAARPVAVE
jgi:hypothetical protein